MAEAGVSASLSFEGKPPTARSSTPAILISCGSDYMRFRPQTPTREVLEQVKLKWAQGMMVDHWGFQVTPISPVLDPGHYEYKLTLSSRLAKELDEGGSHPAKKVKPGSVSAWVTSVLGQIPKKVPMDQVGQFLATQISPIPCSMDISSMLLQKSGHWEGQVEVTGLYLDGLFGAIIGEGFNMTGSKQMTLVGTEVFIGHVFEILSTNAPTGPLSLCLEHDRGSIVSNTSSASYAHGCRPDSYFIVDERLLLVGEDKATQEGIKAATDELRKKSISLAQSHYGSLPYILAYAASGFKCNIHLINTDGEVCGLGLRFDLRTMQGRAALLVTVINMYRLLLSMRDQLPALESFMPDNI